MAIRSELPLAGRVAIVTGAGAGIGQATALGLAAVGANVVLVGRSKDKLEATRREIETISRYRTEPVATIIAGDVCDSATAEQMIHAALDVYGRLDILVCAAGILRPPGSGLRTLAQLGLPEWETILRTNLDGVFYANRFAASIMAGQGSGDIVNLSSTSAIQPLAFDAAYGTSKRALLGFSEALQAEIGSNGVRVTCLIPGPFATEMIGQRFRGVAPDRFPPPSRVADFIVYLVTRPRDMRLCAPRIEPFLGTSPHTLSTSGGESMMQAVSESRRSEHVQTAGKLAGQVVIVTGGAGGIGLAIARAVLAEGGSVVVSDRDADRVRDVVAELRDQHNAADRCMGLAGDVSQETDNTELARATVATFSRIDALVACAGILRKRGTPPKPVAQTSLEEWDEVLSVNLRGVFLSNRAVLPTMIQQRSGCIINLSSVSGLQGRAHDGPYCASKFGVLGLTQALADEVRSYGIKVTAVLPGAVATPLWEQNHPMPPPGDALPPERVADLVLFLLTQPPDTVLVGPVIAPLGARRRKSEPKA